MLFFLAYAATGNRDIVSEYSKIVSTDPAVVRTSIASIIASTKYVSIENMLLYQIPAMETLNNRFVDGMKEYMKEFEKTEKIKFSVFIVGMFIIFVFIWHPYLQSLNIKIWRTKGMLNMIPMEIITKHQNLKQAFR